LETACPQAVSINNKRRRTADRFNNGLVHFTQGAFGKRCVFGIAFIPDYPRLDTSP
jgi:hypothetical protein